MPDALLQVDSTCPCGPRVFFFNDTATTEIYTLSLHDALPICVVDTGVGALAATKARICEPRWKWRRSEEHTSELQSHLNLVCRLLLEKKKGCVQAASRSP